MPGRHPPMEKIDLLTLVLLIVAVVVILKLRSVLGLEAFRDFDRAITERETRGEQIDQSFVGISKAQISDSGLKDGKAHIAVRFVSQLISATRDKAGAVLSGDPQKIKEVTDIWTF